MESYSREYLSLTAKSSVTTGGKQTNMESKVTCWEGGEESGWRGKIRLTSQLILILLIT